jgi:AraC-like DNA-binding protein
MVAAERSWTLERSDRRLRLVSGPAATLFVESGGFRVTRHQHPAWKIVLALGGWVEADIGGGRTVAAPGMVVPPQLAHTCAVSSAYVALLLDPWGLPPGRLPTRLDERQTARMVAAIGRLDGEVDLAAARAEISAGWDVRLEPRVAHAIREVTRAGSIVTVAALAAEMGLSPSRLRTLVRDTVGIPLPRLRQWARLRAAVTELPGESAAAVAAAAGFADQAHLTRTARSLLGRTPSEIAR